MKVKGVIFDVDGLLVDTEKLHVKAWEKIFRKRGIYLSKPDYESGVGISDYEFLQHLKEKGKIPPGFRIDELLNEKESIMLELADGKVKLFPGVLSLLNTLSPRFILSAASNSEKNFVIKVLKNSGIFDYFKVVLTRNDIKRPKPFPDIYLVCLSKMGLSPEECVIIEDSPAGIKAARKAGIRCIAVSHTLPPADLKEADLILENICVEKIMEFIKS